MNTPDLLNVIGRIITALLLIGAGTVYGIGWNRLQRSDERPSKKQAVMFVAGVALAAFTLVSRFAVLATTYYSVREAQHILITGLVPFFLLISEPYVVMSAGLPKPIRHTIKTWGDPKHTVNKVIRMVTSPALVWAMFVSLFWLWHDLALMEAARNYAWVHLLEIGSLMGVAFLYWWHIADARPKLRRPMSPMLRIFYAFAGMLPIKILGIFLLFGNETVVGNSHLGHLAHEGQQMLQIGSLIIADRSLGALLLWVIGGFTYTYTAVFFAGRQMGKEGDKPPLPVSILEQDETWRAPAIDR